MMRGNREMRRMLDKMGLDMKTMDNVEEVIIKTDKKELYLVKPQGGPVVQGRGHHTRHAAGQCLKGKGHQRPYRE